MDLNGNLKLVFVRPVGKNNDDLYEYDLLFSEYPEEVWSLYWDDPNPSSCGDLTPDATTYDVVKRIGVSYELTTIQNTSCYSMEHAMQRIVALSWINIENLEEYPQEGRMVLHYGDDFELVQKKLTVFNIELE
jgi:hypothetical protein